MKISHKIVNVAGQDRIYIYVTVQDIYEFGKENFGNGKDTNFLKNIREYVKNNLKEFSKAALVICINGVVIGTLTLSAIVPDYNKGEALRPNSSNIEIYNEKHDVNIYAEEKTEIIKQDKKEENSIAKEDVETQADKKQQVSNKGTTGTKVTGTSNKKAQSTNKTNSNNKKNNNKVSTTTKTQSTTTKEENPIASQTNKPVTSNTNTDKNEEQNKQENKEQKTEEKTETPAKTENKENITSGRKIKFNNGGVISDIDLEEYVIGVVAAEMPASFHSEALKSQAVVARTYAMKKASKGITLLNSTAHQVYNSTAQMKAKWGSSYNTYYNKIKNAVNATKGQVLKYNGAYIEALYFSMSNGKTELPSYVWNTNYPYLQVVSSSWDQNISAANYNITMSYSTLSSKLGVTVDQNSEIKILSRTAGDRVNEISIAGKKFTGVKVRSLLGLRSADFTIVQNGTGVTITTKGFGHGVGMSQYGANGAAKSGMTYRQILSHYYSGSSLVSL